MDHLSANELEMLLKLHPEGTARFWGATPTRRHDAEIGRLASRDPILFTGLSRVQAVGKVGVKLRNQALADELWPPDPDSWSNVYSVLDFHQVHDLLYSDVRVLMGKPRYPFRGMAVIEGDQAVVLISGLGLNGDAHSHAEEDRQAEEALARALARDSAVVDAEASNTEDSHYERQPGTVIIRRVEARLVDRYLQTLPGEQAKRLRVAVGWTDLYLVDEGDLIEAKRSPTHRYVRQALGQLLDYAAYCTQPLSRLTALFPEVPKSSDVRLLHVYGIDCLYWAGGDDFPRIEAPAEARERMRPAWSSLGRL